MAEGGVGRGPWGGRGKQGGMWAWCQVQSLPPVPEKSAELRPWSLIAGPALQGRPQARLSAQPPQALQV